MHHILISCFDPFIFYFFSSLSCCCNRLHICTMWAAYQQIIVRLERDIPKIYGEKPSLKRNQIFFQKRALFVRNNWWWKNDFEYFFSFFFFFVCSSMRTLYTRSYNSLHYLQLHVHAHVYIIYVYIFSRSRKTHPGAVVHLSDNPLDLSKVRVFFEYVLFCIILHPYHDVIPYIF